jgi:transcriptional regulator with XRE-family HTH domain
MDFPLATVAQFTDHLRALRKARGMTQTDLGRLMGVSQSRIADIERDPGSVSVTQMHQMLSALGGQMILRDSGGGWKLQPSDVARATKTGLVHHTGAGVLASKAPAKPKTSQTLVKTGSKVIRNTPGPSKKRGGSW